MKEKYIIEGKDNFNLKHIFECGQCFRWNKDLDGSYVGVINNGVLKAKEQNDKIIITGVCKENLKNVVLDYFDLENDYDKIKNKLSVIDDNMKNSIKYGYGIRILHQDIWEMLISFIISANNNIPRIKAIIEKMSSTYGEKIIFENRTYYLFPTPEQLGKASVEDLRKLGMGFRDKRVYETTKMVLKNKINLYELENEPTDIVREKLLELPGVGPKVADCIMLFALKRYEVFPIDVWVRRVMNELYIKNIDEEKVNKKELEHLAKEKYGDLAGLAQQYLLYWRREQGA